MKPRGLSVRLAMLMVIATMIMQVGHGLYRFSVDVPTARQKGMDDINKLVASLQPALSEALYQYNESLSDKILKSFSAYESVQTVWMLDSDGSGVGVWVRTDASESSELRELTWDLSYRNEIIGSLVVLVDVSQIENEAILFVWRIIAFSALIGLFALLFLYVIAQSLVTKPIESLSSVVSSINIQNFNRGDITRLNDIRAFYEVETLKRSIEVIMERLVDYHSERERAMALLTKFNQELEVKVKQRTEELENAKDKAELGSRAKTDFMNMMTHELRTPLNGVLGFASILKGRDLEEKNNKLVAGIEQAGQGLLTLLNDIIDYVELEGNSLNIQTFSVYDALMSSYNEAKAKAEEKGLAFTFDVDTSLVMSGDPKRLGVIARQLLSNAIKFTHEGRVSVTCKKADDESIEFIVVDTGIGISEDKLGEVGEQVFNQLDQGLARTSEGVGLGLAVVYRICKKWNGTIRFLKNEPQGTVVCVVLSNIDSK